MKQSIFVFVMILMLSQLMLGRYYVNAYDIDDELSLNSDTVKSRVRGAIMDKSTNKPRLTIYDIFPVAVGNTWEYLEFVGGWPPVTGTTIKIWRIDTSIVDQCYYIFVKNNNMNLYYRIDFNNDSTLYSNFVSGSWYKYLIVNVPLYESWPQYHNNYMAFVGDSTKIEIGREVRYLTYSWFRYKPIDSTEFIYLPGASYYKVGVGKHHYWGDDFSGELIGYIINGQQWGTVNIKDENEQIIQNYSLSQNYPNPFNPTTKINYEIPTSPSISLLQGEGRRERSVSLKIYDILGRELETLVNEQKPAGRYSIEWNASKYSSGIYYYELTVMNGLQPFRATKKMILMK